MSAAFAVSLFPYYNNVIFSAVFLPVLFQQFLPVPCFFLFRFWFGSFPSRPSRCSIFSLPKNFLLLFSCLLPNFFPKLLPASPVGLDPTCPPCFTEPLPSFLRFACIVRFLQRPSCPKFRLSGLYNLCPLPAFPVGLEPICPPRLQSLYRLFTFRLYRPFSAKTLLSEIPSFRSLQSLSLANITVGPKTNLSENPSRFRVVFPADLLLLLYFLSLSRCFRFLISHVPSFLLYCKMQIISFSASPVLFSFPLLSLSKKIILSVSPLHGLCRLSYVSLVSSVFCKDPPVRNSVFQVFTIFVPCQHYHQPENRPVRVSVSAPRRFSCRPFAPSLFSVAFALFSAFSLQKLSPLWVHEFFSFSLSVFCTIFPIDPFSLFLPFTSSLNLLSYPRGLSLAPLAFSLRLSIWKNFPFLIYINELTLSTLFRDKNDVPEPFLF